MKTLDLHTVATSKENRMDELLSSKSEPLYILVVDDLRVNYLLMKAVLGKFNPIFSYCDSGIKAVEHIQSGMPCDLILMDYNMPGMDGTTATEIIKSIRPNLPVISISTFSGNPAFVANDKCYDSYLSKPVNAEALINEVLKLLSPKV
ncbi:hypothetical protein MASR2M12_01150 [Bacteroidales bacterium]